MPKFQTSRRVSHSAANMFALVADVERYPEFVPLCESLRVVSRRPEGGREIVTAAMTVAYKLLRETFTSRVVLEPEARQITVNYIDGPFRYLDNRWRFEETATGSNVHFFIDYEFKSRILGAVMGSMFDRAFRMFSEAFETRATKIYG